MTKNATVFIFVENENGQKLFSFSIFIPTFLDLGNEKKKKKANMFSLVGPQKKTGNKNKTHHVFKGIKHGL